MRRTALAAAILLAAAACRRPAPPAPPATPEAAALAAFSAGASALLEGGDAGDARLVLRRLGEARDPRIVGSSPLPDGGVAVDLEASLGGGARGRYAIHVSRRDDGTWRIVAIGGPGVAWPAGPVPPAEGLGESPAPR